MNESHAVRNWRESFITQAKEAWSPNRGSSRFESPAAVVLKQTSLLTSKEALWFVGLSCFVALLFYANKILLFSEFNNWAVVAYATDFIKTSSTEKYVMRLLNTPNVLFTLIYFYARDVFSSVNSYTLYKLILLACVTLNIYLIIRLSHYKNAYLILLPVVFGYVLVGGMTHYYLSLTLLFIALLLYESGNSSPLKTFLLVILSYHAHFMGFFALMLLVLYKEGIRRTIIYSLVPLILFLSYKHQYRDAYQLGLNYSLSNHFLSVRRLLLPSMTDYNSNIYILLFSGLLNLLFCLYVAYLIFAGYFMPRDHKAFALMLGLVVIYFLVPATALGSGVNIHERLVIPFVLFAIHLAKQKELDRLPIVLFTGLVVANIWLFHSYYEAQGPDYRNPLINKETTGQSASAAQDIIDGKPIDAIDALVFTSGLIEFKRCLGRAANCN